MMAADGRLEIGDGTAVYMEQRSQSKWLLFSNCIELCRTSYCYHRRINIMSSSQNGYVGSQTSTTLNRTVTAGVSVLFALLPTTSDHTHLPLLSFSHNLLPILNIALTSIDGRPIQVRWASSSLCMRKIGIVLTVRWRYFWTFIPCFIPWFIHSSIRSFVFRFHHIPCIE